MVFCRLNHTTTLISLFLQPKALFLYFQHFTLSDLVSSLCDQHLYSCYEMAPSDLRAAFELYIACKPIRPRDNTTLLSYLAEYPDFLPPVDLVPSDELEQRLEIAHEIQKHIQSDIEWQLSAVHLAILMVIPLESLRTVMLSLPVTDPEDLIKSLNSIHALTCHCEILSISKYILIPWKLTSLP